MVNRKSLFIVLLSLIYILSVKVESAQSGSSVFEVSYTKWISKKTIQSFGNSEVHESVFPNNELIMTLPDSNKYLLHKLVDGSVFAVEKLIDLNNNPNSRNRNNQLAGMMLWSLENGFNDLFWSYATSGSVDIRTQFLSYTKSKNDSLCEAFISQKNQYDIRQTDSECILELKSEKLELTATFTIKARLIDLTGNDPNNLAIYFFSLHKNNLEDFESKLFSKSSLNHPLRKGFKWIQNETIEGQFDDEFKTESSFVGEFAENWLTENLADEFINPKAKVVIRYVGRDTLTAQSFYPTKKTLIWLRKSLMSYGEIPAIGLLSVQDSENNLKSVRYILVFRNEESEYEHVVRADVQFKMKNESWIMEQSNLLVMLLTPLGNASE